MSTTVLLFVFAVILLFGFALGICVQEVNLRHREKALAKTRRDRGKAQL